MKRIDGTIVGYQDPVFDAFAITPNDTEDLPSPVRAIYVGVPGNLKVDLAGGSTVTFVSLTPGIWPLEVTRVHSTGSTATSLLGLK